MARDKCSSAESRKNMGDLLEEEPSLDVTPVTLLPVLFNHNVNQSINQSKQTNKQTTNHQPSRRK